MPIVHDEVMALRDDNRAFAWTDNETMLYALGIGMGRDPIDAAELKFVFEGAGLVAMPSMAAVRSRSSLVRELPINMALMLHGEQRLTLYRPLPVAGDIRADTRITAVIDKGAGKGALVYTETAARLAADDSPLYTVGQTLFCRGDGGFGGPAGPIRPVHPIPGRGPDISHETLTRPDQALLYRLTGDRNPLHADPGLAIVAGFPVPILHGLCTYGIACRAVIATACGNDPTRLTSFDVRFTAPVFPGDRIVTEIWVDADIVSFRCRVPDRGVIAIDNGKGILAPIATETPAFALAGAAA